TSYCDKHGVKKGAWSEEEDNKLRAYIERYGHLNWRLVPKFSGVSRSGKSCRLRWMNYLRPNMKHGNFTKVEDNIIKDLHSKIGNKWSAIAVELPGRSDNEIKNRWNTHLKKLADQKDQTMLESAGVGTLKFNHGNPQTNPMDTTDLKLHKDQELLFAKPPSETSVSSFSNELGTYKVNSYDCTVSSDVVPHLFNLEADTNFWTEPFILDNDLWSSEDHLFSPLDLVNDYGYCQDMVIANEFLWST
nr:hypothetical protein [Tanacetum cinerariifolium]GFB02991.1 hypothetical protein [Tanacetum cinerariifolium]